MPRFALQPAAILALCVALGTGCTNRLAPLPPGSGGTGVSDPGPGTGHVMTPDGGGSTASGTDAAPLCFIPLQQTGCAMTWTDQLATDPGCSRGESGSQAGGCGGYLVWSSGASNVLGSLVCIYDANLNVLVSGTVCTDISIYCNRDFCASGGAGIDVSTLCDVSSLPLVCPNADGSIIIDGGSTDASDGGSTGAGDGGALCPQPSLVTSWPVLPGCVGTTPLTFRCPLPGLISDPMYPAFVGCCPPDAPFACGNGTPTACFSTAEEAAASCGSACIQCTPYSDLPIPH